MHDVQPHPNGERAICHLCFASSLFNAVVCWFVRSGPTLYSSQSKIQASKMDEALAEIRVSAMVIKQSEAQQEGRKDW